MAEAEQVTDLFLLIGLLVEEMYMEKVLVAKEVDHPHFHMQQLCYQILELQ